VCRALMALGRKTGLLCLFPPAIHRTGNGKDEKGMHNKPEMGDGEDSEVHPRANTAVRLLLLDFLITQHSCGHYFLEGPQQSGIIFRVRFYNWRID
jgi:hypothetical protein